MPDHTVIRAAIALLGQHRPGQAILTLLPHCQQYPGDAQAHFLLGVAYHQTGQLEAALSALDTTLALDPRHLQARSAKGAVLCDLGRHQEALQVYRKALHLAPGDAQLQVNIGVVLEQMGNKAGALEHYDLALKQQPDFPAALLNRGTLLLQLKRLDEALVNNQRLATRYPDWGAALYNLGEVLLANGQYQSALDAYEGALTITPNFVKALFAKGLVLSMLRRFDLAQYAIDQARLLDPIVVEQCIHAAMALSVDVVREFSSATIYLLNESQHLENCDWAKRNQFIADFVALIEHPGPTGLLLERALVYRTLSLPMAGGTRLKLAQTVSAHISRQTQTAQQPAFVHHTKPNHKLRVGYISADFRFHPVGRLTRRLYGLHDRSRFQVYGYALKPGDGGVIRRDIEQGCDVFRDMSALSDAQAAAAIHADQIDILVDLSGYTTDARSEILARQPAPIQVSFNGFPGSTGAAFIQYFITDKICSPPGQQSDFSEQLVYLPNSCMIYDHLEKISDRAMSRSEHGLPEQGFVFCCFNNSYKIEPVMFAVWMRLLKQIPGSVLWLFGKNEAVVKNLQQTAEQSGVSPARLVFAGFEPKLEEHLARYRLADLFLDTLHFNAVTTAADALWAGLPVLTCPGQTFISRWAASLLYAVGLEEMITTDLEHYEQRALFFARHADVLQTVKDKLAKNRLTTPLFDTPQVVRNLEAAYVMMQEKSVLLGAR